MILTYLLGLLFLGRSPCAHEPPQAALDAQTVLKANQLKNDKSYTVPYQPQRPPTTSRNAPDHAVENDSTLFSNYSALVEGLHVMQAHFFEIKVGTWPNAIDWTAEMMATHISATLATISESSPASDSAPGTTEAGDVENDINRYFTQLASFYFGENDFSLRTQAYDDMLWVVLDWLEAIKFIDLHSDLHHEQASVKNKNENISQWYARQFIPQFAHRARLFYDIASRGWDTNLCGGGMVWNPRLTPYKNAITNELYITASISMYLHFPGDSNHSPFVVDAYEPQMLPAAKAHDKKYLHNAVQGYKWLKESGMRNEQGLYVDGFHIDGWRGGRSPSNGSGECDMRNEMVYTYNQGVLLSGLRYLWEATGELEYLEDAHELARDVMIATGWSGRDLPGKWRWAGLGRNGVMEDACDWSGGCSQNGQTFKGIFFHHFNIFCAALPVIPDDSDRPWLRRGEIHTSHQELCEGYGEWVVRNAEAAMATKDENGEFGQWWGRQASTEADGNPEDDPNNRLEQPAINGTDLMNNGIPIGELWRLPEEDPAASNPLVRGNTWRGMQQSLYIRSEKPHSHWDLNDRGRGRTRWTWSGASGMEFIGEQVDTITIIYEI
ncbi:uncharacterized protein KY384_001322 [Bacidia gigantensis]|uniref:uncharacterized protein n=1 Tax=Bacidia gigantensis TaxID=2732470 RepID=UPI001D053A96|nr:uncharacterized protein KY384_001322 [Bacidia gigantensis]KAG8533582.1 hypothetical protein KY384_001322 [Bacidia gigantensis]